MNLRNYQKDQLKFLQSKISNQTWLFNNNIALESPTGSGKSIVMLEFIKEYYKNNKDITFISTGFNNLVTQFYQTAQQFNIPTLILIGRNNCACTLKMDDKAKKQYNIKNAFLAPYKYKAKYSECYKCKHKSKCLYGAIINTIKKSYKHNYPLLIITNHSTLINNQNLFQQYTVGGFIDECQTFADFYDSFLRLEIEYPKLKTLATYLQNNKKTEKNPLTKLYTAAMKHGTLTRGMLNKIINIDVGNNKKLIDVYPAICKNIMIYTDTYDQLDNYIYPQKYNNINIGLRVDQYYDTINLNMPVCLTSATIDEYTKSIFGGITQENLYKETNANTIDYTQSAVYTYDTFDINTIKQFLDINKTATHGLLLSTRLDILDKLPAYINSFEIIFKIKDFVPNKKQILVGSRKLFQGVDITDLDFVMLNKLPFETYDQAYKKHMRFFEARGHQPFLYYTIPHVINQLIQATGRLWRSPGSKGNIAIFDKKACIKHKNILDAAFNTRKGIKIYL